MPHDNSSGCDDSVVADRCVRWATPLTAVVLIALLTIVVGRNDVDQPRSTHATGYERGQAQQTITILGYHTIAELAKHDDGSWRAEAQKDGSRWHIQISPYGVVSAQLVKPAHLRVSDSPSQLGIVLQ